MKEFLDKGGISGELSWGKFSHSLIKRTYIAKMTYFSLKRYNVVLLQAKGTTNALLMQNEDLCG